MRKLIGAGMLAVAACGGNATSDSGSGGGGTGASGGQAASGGVGATGGGGLGATGGYGCFEAGTLIATPFGSTPIERLRVGDWVLAYDAKLHRTVPRPVTATMIHPGERVGELPVGDGRALRVTPNHPIYLPDDDRYARADAMVEQRRVLVLGNNRAVASAVSYPFALSAVERIATVYNIEVAEEHNYFADGVLVHNKSGGMPNCIPTDGASGGPGGECQTTEPCLDPNPATWPSAETGSAGAYEERALCSPADPAATYLVAMDAFSESPFARFDVQSGDQACEGAMVGALALPLQAAAWSTHCFALPGDKLDLFLAVGADPAWSGNTKLKNLRFVSECACKRKLFAAGQCYPIHTSDCE